MDGVVEIITGRERRRRWSTEDKLRMVAELAEPGTRVRAGAARHGVCIEPGVAVGVQEPAARAEQRLGMHALAIGRKRSGGATFPWVG